MDDNPGANVRKVQPYWSTMADDLEVWHDIATCPEAQKIPPYRMRSAGTPPPARRHCTACLFLGR